MTSEVWVRLGVAGIAFLGTVVAWAFARRNSNRDSVSSAAAAVAEGAQDVMEMMQALVAPLKDEIHHLTERVEAQQLEINTMREQLAENQEQLAENDRQTSMLTAIVRHMRDYVRVLRRQIIELGHDPVPFPDELEHMNGEG